MILPHSELVNIAARLVGNNGFPMVLKEVRGTIEEPDVFGMAADNRTLMVECKAFREDFLADAKKPFRIDPKLGVGLGRMLLINKDVCTLDEIPEGWGLAIAVDRNTIHFEKHPRPVFKERNISEEIKFLYFWKTGKGSDPGTPVMFQ